MGGRWLFIGIGTLAMLAGAGLWWAQRERPALAPPQIAPAALYATTFHRTDGTAVALGEYAGRPLVLNFWATWCAPCRTEMPEFDALQKRFGAAVAFVGLTSDDPARVERFARQSPVSYALLVGGAEVDALAVALGNRNNVLPFTVVLDRAGRIVARHVGAYPRDDLAAILATTQAEQPPK